MPFLSIFPMCHYIICPRLWAELFCVFSCWSPYFLERLIFPLISFLIYYFMHTSVCVTHICNSKVWWLEEQPWEHAHFTDLQALLPISLPCSYWLDFVFLILQLFCLNFKLCKTCKNSAKNPYMLIYTYIYVHIYIYTHML